MANSRILVEEPIFDEFCERFVEAAKSLKVGDPRDPDTVIGPLIHGSQCAVIDAHVDDAVSKGPQLLCGGQARGAILLANSAERRHERHAHFPRGELRSRHVDH
jgi:aldehyde dehydrogenase (NAD+)